MLKITIMSGFQNVFETIFAISLIVYALKAKLPQAIYACVFYIAFSEANLAFKVNESSYLNPSQ